MLLFVYSLGLGIPFLLLALTVDRATAILRRAQRVLRVVTVVSGLFLIIVGMMVFTNRLGLLARWAPLFDI